MAKPVPNSPFFIAVLTTHPFVGPPPVGGIEKILLLYKHPTHKPATWLSPRVTLNEKRALL